jgi:hypothetical protein
MVRMGEILKFIIFFTSLFLGLPAFSQAPFQLTEEETMAVLQARQMGQPIGAAGGLGPGQGCVSGMLGAISQGIGDYVQTVANNNNALMQISQRYFEQEQRCGNELAEPMLELNQARAEHEQKLIQLPNEIELKKIEYEEALLSIQQECEQTSGETFMQWKQQLGTGIVDAKQGGVGGLVNRQRNLNRYQKLFYDDCLASRSNLKRADILARKLRANIRSLQNEVDSSANSLGHLSKNLSFKQGITAKNCMAAREQLKYQEALTKQTMSVTNSGTMAQNALRLLNSAAMCMGGPGNNLNTPRDSTRTGV